MSTLTADEAREQFDTLLQRATQEHQATLIQREGKEIAAVVPIEYMRLLEQLVEEQEDREDVAAAEAALAEKGESIPWEQLKKELDLAD